ncbi:primosomal protein N' [Craterilacuibacter sp.]|uniref:primosomal protein N' n=1 Tax=Craterilacuibacter sp. TaxID=2870909 RepID=UPI003F2B2BBD
MDTFETVEVLLDVPLHGTFTYLAPAALAPGTRVEVNFRGRKQCAVVSSGVVSPALDPAKIKPVAGVFDELPPLPAALLRLIDFVAAYYHYPKGAALFTALPTALRVPQAARLADRRLWGLTTVGLAEAPPPRQRARLALWQALQGGALPLAALRAVSMQAGKVLAQWQEEGKAERVLPALPELAVAAGPGLNQEQQAALDAISASFGHFQSWLLQGVTGSGKTEVYLRLIECALAAGRQVLVLVPEISLTPQLLQRFAGRFPATRIAALHSSLADGERLEAWVDAWQGRAGIVIGTRLSVFVPLPALGLIVVDEEHDGSLKQQDGLRYHARDLAIWRARDAGVPIVLGSATPSLETVANAEAGRYRRLYLRERAHAGAVLPAVHLVDTRLLRLTDGLSEPVVAALQKRLQRREMSLVFINRRGYSPVLACPQCGWTSGCKRCSSKLVLHLMQRVLRCHHCGWEEAVPRVCPDCGNLDIQPLGEGTQRLESAIQRLLPEARVLRIDRDSTRSKDAWDEVYRKVHAGEVDILIGTQMLAKGHDFGALSLVLVLGADGGLYSADFRAGERLFSMLMQVAGRAGRAGLRGEVLVQTQWPEHPLYLSLVAHDFDGFAIRELAARRDAHFPPLIFQALLRADAHAAHEADAFLQQVKDEAGAWAGPVALFGPAPATMARLAGRERMQLVIECADRRALHQFLDSLLPVLAGLGRKAARGLRWSLDVDPTEM